jgi:hypothetical protein
MSDGAMAARMEAEHYGELRKRELAAQKVRHARLETAHDLLYRAMGALEETGEDVPLTVEEEDVHAAARIAWLMARGARGER